MREQPYSTSPLYVQNVMNSKFGRQQTVARHCPYRSIYELTV